MLRAREPRLLNNERAERMLDAASFEDAAKILTDCGYPDMSQMTAAAVEQTLAEHRSEIFEELGRLSPDKELVDVFKLKYDYHNAKAIIKAEAMGSDAKRLLSDAGRVSGAELLELYHAERYSQLPPTFGKAMAEARSVLARTANPQLSDFVLDKAYFEELRAVADKLNNAFLRGYAAVLSDSANLKSAVRTLRMGKNQDFLAEVLVDGGEIEARRVIAAADKEGLAALYAHTALERAAQLGAEALSGGSMTDFERACDNAVNTYLRSAKLVSYGPEAVIAYLAAIEGEVQAVRMILTGRLAGVRPQVIRERLRDLYA
jgi:V/A-type H+-transporting ATPase subunit C